ncbi:TOBE domain-containing protein [Celerinatantimonas yamalensis]|uniref:TOBE domain-containing protein n=1 Tax=Celerinatantimonas yamalensis TaxID=559956 RepID=A0ABW9G636_9GAMM
MNDAILTTLLPLQLQISGHPLVSEQRICLLEAIERHGSLNAAAKALPMSYKAAWDALDTMNNLAEQPLVIRQSGGRHGGGTLLTSAGRQLIRIYRALQLEYQHSLAQLRALVQAQPDLQLDQVRRMLRQMHFQSSARNQFSGKVIALRQHGVNAQVVIGAGDDFELKASVTSESVSELMLTPGTQVLALIKAPQLKVYRLDALTRRPANNYVGEIIRMLPDARHCQLSIAVGQHKRLGALITQARSQQLALQLGQTVGVGFSPASVVLCRYDI